MNLTENILAKIRSLNLDEDIASDIIKDLNGIQKEIDKKDFIIDRTQKEKLIAGKFLNKTIEDLQEKQGEIALVNERLQSQKQEIEIKNLELLYQKKLVEEQSIILEKNLKRLENSYKELDQFSSMASHDLKSPLRTITTFAQLLQKRYADKLDAQADDFINFVVKGARQMDQVISDLLRYSKVGIKDADFELLDLNETMERVQFNLMRDIEDNKATIEIDPMPSKLFANQSSMIQLFQNLIGNAIKFRNTQAPVVKISVNEDKDGYDFVVADNGVGMNEEFQRKAFEPFQRLNNQDRPGSGMGLAICRKITQMHGGSIRFESKEGQGTTFYFHISKGIEGKSKLDLIMATAGN